MTEREEIEQEAFDRLSSRINDGSVENDQIILTLCLIKKIRRIEARLFPLPPGTTYVDAGKTEIEQLQSIIWACDDAEIERLRSENAELLRENAQINCDDGAEIERLREELHHANGTCDLAMKHRNEAEAEIERLRAALKAITLRSEP